MKGKLLKRIALVLLGAFAATVVIYWFNLENKLIYYVIQPLLGKIYDSRPRDVRL